MSSLEVVETWPQFRATVADIVASRLAAGMSPGTWAVVLTASEIYRFAAQTASETFLIELAGITHDATALICVVSDDDLLRSVVWDGTRTCTNCVVYRPNTTAVPGGDAVMAPLAGRWVMRSAN